VAKATHMFNALSARLEVVPLPNRESRTRKSGSANPGSRKPEFPPSPQPLWVLECPVEIVRGLVEFVLTLGRG
jgi:hypothetical protein